DSPAARRVGPAWLSPQAAGRWAPRGCVLDIRGAGLSSGALRARWPSDTFNPAGPGSGRQIFPTEARMPQRVIDGVAELRRLVGQEVGLSDWFAVTQERINAFAEVSEDRQWIHCDADRARAESPYGTTIAHGYLTLSLLSHLLAQAVRVR